jgi:hypothetical protein
MLIFLSGVEGLAVIFWLTSFALLAQEDQAWNAAENFIGDDGYSFDSKASAAIDATKAATAFAALNWALFVATLITFGTSEQMPLHPGRIMAEQ